MLPTRPKPHHLSSCSSGFTPLPLPRRDHPSPMRQSALHLTNSCGPLLSSSLTSLESILTKSLPANPIRINTYDKDGVGVHKSPVTSHKSQIPTTLHHSCARKSFSCHSYERGWGIPPTPATKSANSCTSSLQLKPRLSGDFTLNFKLLTLNYFCQNSFGSRFPSLAIFSSSGNFSRSGSGTFTFEACSIAISSSAFTTPLPW